MKLDKDAVYDHLIECGITHLYHANSVTTAKTFIEQGGLLSRGMVEKLGLLQTGQDSDNEDKTHDVWNDIFLDNGDLHNRFNKRNDYGPISFKFNIDILTMKNLPDIHVTKSNPLYWRDSMSIQNKHFQDIHDFKQIYTKKSYAEMLTLKNTNSKLPFKYYLSEIIIDNPIHNINDINLGDYAFDQIKNAINTSKFKFDYNNVQVKHRNCRDPYCKCKDEYPTDKIKKIEELFFVI